ncbi:MAG: ubiquinone/menaquinone biosynthesis methyltransferase [Lachnospiraceae bacterium]|nr:ubiquinone/menaquinone biosynthesis methyltransferase [Lachnospiraceae bacterium]
MDELERQRELKREKVYRVFETIAGGYDSANVRISLGMQSRWKEMLVKRLIRRTEEHFPGTRQLRILDLCTGTGDIAVSIARRRPDWEITGLDFSPAMLRRARLKGRKRGLRGLRWKKGDAAAIPFPDGSFEAVSISFGLRNCADTAAVLKETARVLKRGGTFMCIDSFTPQLQVVKPFYRLYFQKIMPLLGGGKAHRGEYEWLSDSTEQFLSPKELAALMRASGFGNIVIRQRMLGACVLLETTRL